jgi:predicted ester cyclase
MNIPPTGKQVTSSAIAICRIADGKIVEEWSQVDLLGMLQQLGVIPPMG